MEKVNWNIKNQLKDVEISKVDSIISQILNESTTQSKLCCNIAKQNYLERYSANPKPLEVDVLPMFSSETYAVICARLSGGPIPCFSQEQSKLHKCRSKNNREYCNKYTCRIF